MADFKLEIPINVSGQGTSGANSDKIGNNIAEAVAKRLKVLLPSKGKTGGKGGMTGGLATEAMGDVASGASKNAKGFKSVVGAMGKVGGIMGAVGAVVGVIAMAVSALSDFLKPVFALLKVILMLLFLPLIPILKPVMKALGEFAKRLAPIMMKLSKTMENILTPRLNKLLEGAIDFIVRHLESFINILVSLLDIWDQVIGPLGDVLINGILKVLEFFSDRGAEFFGVILDILLWAGEFLTTSWDAIKNALEWVGEFLEPVWEIIKTALVEAGDFLQERWDDILKILERTADLLEGVATKIKNIGFGGLTGFAKTMIMPFVGSFATGGSIKETGMALVHKGETVIPAGLSSGSVVVNINNPSVRSNSDIKALADEVSRVLQRQMGGRMS